MTRGRDNSNNLANRMDKTVTGEQLECRYCANSFPNTRTNCPHCAQPQIFPNVTKATTDAQKTRLAESFSSAKDRCGADGRDQQFDELLIATSHSHALFACPLLKLHQLVASGTDIFATYYQLEELRLRASAPIGMEWARLRPQAEIELLGSEHHIRHLHYACLSLDWESLSNYGDCAVKLSESMIGHRASCFEGNSAVIFARRRSFDDCLRSSWEERGKLCCAVLADKVTKDTVSTEFSSLLVQTKDDSVDDEFVEVHIFGTMTVQTFAEVRFSTASHGRKEDVYRNAIIEKLDAVSVAHSGG